MSGYNVAVVLHVLIAVLGVGQVGAVALAATSARRSRGEVRSLAPLVRCTRFSLAAMVATGVWMEIASAGAHRGLWWLRVSAILIVVTFFFQRRAMAALQDPRRLERAAWSMCGAIALITVLMQMKPF
jgi:hypothetical protein